MDCYLKKFANSCVYVLKICLHIEQFGIIQKSISKFAMFLTQGSHRLEKYLNLEGFLEKSLKIKSALKSTGNPLASTGSILSNTDLSDLSTVGSCDIFVYQMRHRVM